MNPIKEKPIETHFHGAPNYTPSLSSDGRGWGYFFSLMALASIFFLGLLDWRFLWRSHLHQSVTSFSFLFFYSALFSLFSSRFAALVVCVCVCVCVCVFPASARPQPIRAARSSTSSPDWPARPWPRPLHPPPSPSSSISSWMASSRAFLPSCIRFTWVLVKFYCDLLGLIGLY